jgi:hypothetical protein
MNPRAGLNEPKKRKIFFPCAGIRTQIFQSITHGLSGPELGYLIVKLKYYEEKKTHLYVITYIV